MQDCHFRPIDLLRRAKEKEAKMTDTPMYCISTYSRLLQKAVASSWSLFHPYRVTFSFFFHDRLELIQTSRVTEWSRELVRSKTNCQGIGWMCGNSPYNCFRRVKIMVQLHRNFTSVVSAFHISQKGNIMAPEGGGWFNCGVVDWVSGRSPLCLLEFPFASFLSQSIHTAIFKSRPLLLSPDFFWVMRRAFTGWELMDVSGSIKVAIRQTYLYGF